MKTKDRTMNQDHENSSAFSRRKFIQSCAVGATAVAAAPLLRSTAAILPTPGKDLEIIPLDRDWLFAGRTGAELPAATAAAAPVTLPHCVSPLSWQEWDPSAWQHVWAYHQSFNLPERLDGRRVFLHFDGVMVGTTPVINGKRLACHLGGYLPSEYEITDAVRLGANQLTVEVDSRWSDVPPEGSPLGAKRIDYLEPGGIYRSADIKLVPETFIRDVFAKPVKVLDSDRRVELLCTLDALKAVKGPVQMQASVVKDGHLAGTAQSTVLIDKPGLKEVPLVIDKLQDIRLWHVDDPNLYHVVTTISQGGKQIHEHRERFGFRDARFELDGFFLNGKRLQLFGLNRHELYPYAGGAMPRRVLRHDAEILRRELNCNMVRCSHYPQSEAFLQACDELGLMVWEEVPGWGYLGDESWKKLLVRDVRDMVTRDRNHASIIIWGVRVNESPNDPVLYRRTKEVAKSLDDSRPTSGSMTSGSIKTWKQDWHQDVFAYDDYHATPDGKVDIRKPVDGVPYMLAEAVGQFNYNTGKAFDRYYRRAGDVEAQQEQALRHAQAHNAAAADPRNCGVIAWCAFEYGSLINAYKNVKYPGVSDFFRIPKLGASFYQAQVDPGVKIVIAADFYWDFGKQTPSGPGKAVAIFSNCDRLELYVDGVHRATAHPDRNNYPHLSYPPFFADLELAATGFPELRIDGYVKTALAGSRSFSSDPKEDKLFLQADDEQLLADGSDATRLVFRVTDNYGNPRPFAGGKVRFNITGPAVLVGNNPFDLAESGGAAAVWIKTKAHAAGGATVTATHEQLGSKTIRIKVIPASEADPVPKV